MKQLEQKIWTTKEIQSGDLSYTFKNIDNITYVKVFGMPGSIIKFNLDSGSSNNIVIGHTGAYEFRGEGIKGVNIIVEDVDTSFMYSMRNKGELEPDEIEKFSITVIAYGDKKE